MSHLNGVNFSNDQISAYPDIPLQYDYSEWEGKTILATVNEYPRTQAMKLQSAMPKITDKSLVRQLIDPNPKKENFTNPLWINNMQLVLFVILIFVIVMQIKLHIQLDMITKYALPPASVLSVK